MSKLKEQYRSVILNDSSSDLELKRAIEWMLMNGLTNEISVFFKKISPPRKRVLVKSILECIFCHFTNEDLALELISDSGTSNVRLGIIYDVVKGMYVLIEIVIN